MLNGGSGDDELFGSAGVDTLDGGDGSDTLDGGSGEVDLASYATADGEADTIRGAQGLGDSAEINALLDTLVRVEMTT